MNAQAILDFVEAINQQDSEGIYKLMSEDHVFIDAHGNRANDRNQLKAGWEGYFQWFPDYNIEITDLFDNGEVFAAFGFASGTYKDNSSQSASHWRIPAAWKVGVANGKIKLWQVYADTKIPSDILERYQNN